MLLAPRLVVKGGKRLASLRFFLKKKETESTRTYIELVHPKTGVGEIIVMMGIRIDAKYRHYLSCGCLPVVCTRASSVLVTQ